MNGVRSNGTTVALPAASVVATLVGLASLPSTMRIHWTLGLGPYYGPTFAPTTPILVSATLAVVFTTLGGLWLADRSPPDPAGAIRLLAAGVAGTLLVCQVVLVVVNL